MGMRMGRRVGMRIGTRIGMREVSGVPSKVLAQTEIVTIPTADVGVPVSVKAYYISRGIDIRRVENNLYRLSFSPLLNSYP